MYVFTVVSHASSSIRDGMTMISSDAWIICTSILSGTSLSDGP
jgi:hypothetical protein